MDTSSRAEPRLPVPTEPERGSGGLRAYIVAGALAIGALTSFALGVWHPEGDDDTFAYADIEPIRTEWWAWHYFGAVGIALATIAFAYAVWSLVRSRGEALANVGGPILILGGLLFGVAIASEGVLFAYITDTDAVPAAQGTAMMDYVNDSPELFVVGVWAGFLLLAVGTFLLAGALWRSGVVPRWVPVLLGATQVATAVAPFGVFSTIADGMFTAGLLTVGWYLWREASSGRRLRPNRPPQ